MRNCIFLFLTLFFFACNKGVTTQTPGAETDNEFDKGSGIQAVELSDEKVEDLYALGLVWGFLKYYHPVVAAGEYNWDYELFRVLPEILKTEDIRERDRILTGWIRGLGYFKTHKKIEYKGEIKTLPDLDWITAMGFSPDLMAELEKVKKAKRSGTHYYIELVPGVSNPVFVHEKPYSGVAYPDAGFRLLSLYRYWNMIQYYFPYKNLIEEDWKGVLREFIPTFLYASDILEYKLAILQLIARIQDTHANIWGKDENMNRYRGVRFAQPIITFVEEKAVVTGFYDGKIRNRTGMQVGDIITHIDGRTVEDIIREKQPYVPASNRSALLRNISSTLLRTNNPSIRVHYIRNKEARFAELTGYHRYEINPVQPASVDTCFSFIRPDIGYLYLGKIKNDYLPEIMEAVKNTKGLIIDLRSYPSEFVVFSLGKYLMPKATDFVKFSHGSIREPGLFTFTANQKVGEPNNKDYYKGRVVILNNEQTQSQAEYTTMAFRVAPRATVIGSTTAGADGNVSEIVLPGNIQTTISGIGVYYPDGRETQRVGIIPDVEVKPTVEGIRRKKDELIEKAIEIIDKD